MGHVTAVKRENRCGGNMNEESSKRPKWSGGMKKSPENPNCGAAAGHFSGQYFKFRARNCHRFGHKNAARWEKIAEIRATLSVRTCSHTYNTRKTGLYVPL